MADTERLWVTLNGKDVTEGIEIRAPNPYSWGVHEIWHVKGPIAPGVVDEQKVGILYCGYPEDFAEGYGWRMEDADAA